MTLALAALVLSQQGNHYVRAQDPDRLTEVRVRLVKTVGLLSKKDGRYANVSTVWREPAVVDAVARAFLKTPQAGNPYLVSRCVFYKASDAMPAYAGVVGLEYADKAEWPTLWRALKEAMVQGLDGLRPGVKNVSFRTPRHGFTVPPAQAAAVVANLRCVPAEWVGAYDLPVRSLVVGGRARNAALTFEVRDARGNIALGHLAVPRELLEHPGTHPSALLAQLLRAYRLGGALPDWPVGPNGNDPRFGPTGQTFPPPAFVPNYKSP